MSQTITTLSGIDLRCQEISESDKYFGHLVTYCKRYWGTQMMDYGSSICPEADKFIDRNRLAWKMQAERDASEHKDLEDRTPDEDGDTRMIGALDGALEDQMENSATRADYHESLCLLYATPYAEECKRHSVSFYDDPILIRADYSRIYDQLMQAHNKGHKAVITGQPGVGKSFFMNYLLWRLVCNEVPVLYKLDPGLEEYILLDQKQAFLVLPAAITKAVLKFNMKMWILVDAIASPDGIPPQFLIMRGPNAMFVYSSSPRSSRWRLTNQSNIYLETLTMNPWSNWEAELLVKFLGFSPMNRLENNANWIESRNIFELDGPIPRLFIQDLDIDVWRKGRDEALNDLTYDTLKKMLRATSSQTGMSDNISHKLFLVRREDLINARSFAIISIITRNVEEKLRKKAMEMERSQLLDLYATTCVAPFTRRVAGVFYEGYCFKHMVDHGIHLNLLKMVRLQGFDQLEKKSRFRSSHRQIENSELEKERQKVISQPETVDIAGGDLCVKYYDKSDGNGQLEENTLYLPEASNEKSLDAFFMHKSCLYILQFTIAEEHSVKPMDDFFSRYTGCPSSNNWKFVFIIDGSNILRVPSKNYAFTLYSAIVNPKDRGLSSLQ